MDSHIRLLHEKEDIVGEMVQVNEQKVNLEKQLRSLQKNNSILASDVRKIIESLGSEDRGDILTLIARLDSETFALKSYNDQLSSCLSNLDKNSDCENGSFRQSVDGRRVENLMMDMSTSDDFDRESIASSMSELSMRNKELDVQVKGLQNQIETYEREIKYFELLHSDWQTERQAMEDLLLRLRAQLRMKEESLSVITAEKGLIAVKKKCPEEIQLKPPSVETEEFDTSDNLLERLEEQIEELMQVNAQFENEKEVLKAENNALLEELSTLRNLRQSFDSKLDKSDNNEREPSKVDKIVMEKEEQIHALNSEKESLESSLLELDQQHQEEIEEFVNLKMTLTKSNKKLQSEIEELKYALEMKETENCQLKTEVETVREQLADLFEAAGKKSSFGDKEQDDVKKETVQSILNAFQAINLDNIHLEENITSLEEGRKELEDTIKELENKNKNLVLRNEELEMDVRDLRDENRQLSEKLQETEIAYDNQPVNEQNLEKLIEVEANYEFLKQENSNLKEELEKQHLKYTEMAQKHLEMQDSQSKIEISYEENCKKLEKVKAELSQKEDEIHALKDIKSANCNCSDKSIQVDFTIQDVGELQNELKVTQQKLLNCTKRLDSITDGNFCGGQQQTFDCSCDDLENWKERCTEKQMINYSCEEQKNGLVLENKEFYNLKENLNNSVADKENKMLEKIISDQKEELESLKKQFESANRSSKSVGNQYDDSKFRKSQEKIQQLEIEKEQMLAVLNEKSRECSNLKNEVHRLVNIVSAEKQAISKLQEDNQELIKQRDSPDQEMTKEAVQNLCRLVRDKDLEIEALNQKNGTLLAVIQQSSDSDHTKELLKQCETLAKQLGAYKADREQIINALNQKHQESLKYHAEVQKLKSLLEMETHKLNTLTHNHESVSQQYEEKQKSLVNTQNEVIGLKQRVSDLEKQHTDLEEKYRELLNRENGKAMANITKEELNKNYEELDKLKELVEEKDKWIFEKDQLIHGLSQDLQKLSDNFKQKENEVGILQKQTENLVLHLKETKDESNSTKERNQNLQQQLTNYQSEMNLMKELNERLNMTVQEKDFEIKALQEKVSTLTPMVQEKMNETGNMKQILMESDAMQQKAQHFHHERDEALLALSQRQQENEELKNEIQRLKEREKRLNNELERLRDHLLQVEESYTKEALKAEEREKELRNRLNQAEEQARMSSNAVHNANQHANMQLESLQEQLSLIVKQRDRAQNQVSEYEDKVQQYAASLANLQLVLEQFQKERERDIQILKKQHAAEVAKEKSKVKDLVMDIQEKEEQLSEAKEALDAASRLSEQLDTKEEVINSLKQEVSTITSALQKALEEIRDMKTNTEGKVDRQVMKSLVLGYFGAPLGQKPDVIRLLARVLDFSQEEMSKAGIKVGRESSQVTPNQRSKGWISGLFGKTPSPVPENQSRRDEREANKSFTALFVQFLQEESQPRFNVKLPAEEMARELAEKGHRPQRPPRINPFDPSVSSPTPTVTTRTNLDHPLIRPISSSLPTFTPILVTADEAASKSNTFLREVLN
ncbi:thyroid receptor-interacting protein 11-like [Centruroides sculpturatus]|uniref:thyroid receptor-interacting protein 11-like n=1 Tax=Centruroides sculpturatus TaxID=218467 RepID=UPI000C6CF992|nr:thyroid receptor-interacting protein 11-like [Centruroides sculpturatus]XP_023224959.1 thyroid receptor-interacting protein 11-like [Centruroides sculpturatus]